jgi:hypothetical protein
VEWLLEALKAVAGCLFPETLETPVSSSYDPICLVVLDLFTDEILTTQTSIEYLAIPAFPIVHNSDRTGRDPVINGPRAHQQPHHLPTVTYDKSEPNPSCPVGGRGGMCHE